MDRGKQIFVHDLKLVKANREVKEVKLMDSKINLNTVSHYVQVNSKFWRFSLFTVFSIREGWLRKNLGDKLKLETNLVIKRIIRMELIQCQLQGSRFYKFKSHFPPVSSGKMNDCQAT